MEERREMSKETKWGTLGNVKMAYYDEGKTSEGPGGKAGEAPVSSKAPPPNAPTAYWGDLKVEDDTETRKGGIARGSIQKEKNPHGKTPKEKAPTEKMPIGKTPIWETKGKDGEGKNSKGGETLLTVDEDTGTSESIYPPHTTGEGNWGQRSAETSTPTRSGSIKMNGHIRMEAGGEPEIRRRKK